MKKQNSNLYHAKINKNDEFYTQFTDIEKELKHYKKHFKGKVVYCNCDDPYESNFFKYFAVKFNDFGLKKLIATSYIKSTIVGDEIQLFEGPFKIELTELTDVNGDGAVDLGDVEWLLKNDKNVVTPLKGDGDFRSEECIEILKECDIVVTNPPFSLFREYVAQLMKYDKKFLIIGSDNAITYKDIFPLLKGDKVCLGHRKVKQFVKPNGEIKKFGNIGWYTNLDTIKRHERIILYKKYNEEEYPKYDNYDAINVNKVKDIPMDYDGAMGVPITFMDKYNPKQFEILGIDAYIKGNKTPNKRFRISDKELYARIVIRHKKTLKKGNK